MLTPEQTCLLTLASEAWQQRGAAKQLGLGYHEETITEVVLLGLKLRYPGDVRIIAFSKAQEADRGADWMWTFISADGRYSISMLVQAKRLDDRELAYPGIKRLVGKRKPPILQIEQLIRTAANYGVPPMFVFYNHLSDPGRLGRSCASLLLGTAELTEAWGVSIASAHDVAAALPFETFDRHVGHSVPLHCMLCTRGNGTYGPYGSPGAIAATLARLGRLSDEPTDLERAGLRSLLHPTAQLALRAERGPGDGVAGLIAQEFPDLAGVVVLRDSGEAQPSAE